MDLGWAGLGMRRVQVDDYAQDTHVGFVLDRFLVLQKSVGLIRIGYCLYM
jgi:hypothetical protein